MNKQQILDKIDFPDDVRDVIENCQSIVLADDVKDLIELSVLNDSGTQVVSFDIPGQGVIDEAIVHRVKNGIAANYCEPYLRRRDPESMIVADDLPSDKVKYKDIFNKDFADLRQETFDWLKEQDLAMFCFASGQMLDEFPSIAIVPLNSGFFALGLALLQGLVRMSEFEGVFKPNVFLYCAPPFRHTHFDGKQRVVHNRTREKYEVFSYNLYPGPSAKKGIYGALIHFGELEGWVTAHASAVQVITPYDNKIVIMHEGASGGGKSEMNEFIHREQDGSILLGTNTVTSEKRYLYIQRTCKLRAITDDMAICHTKLQKDNGKLQIADAERGWFIRVDHITKYGTDPEMEKLAIHPHNPLLFLNIDTQANATALLWEHIEDAPGKPCPNPRFVQRRSNIPRVINSSISVDIRSFGVRTPPCTKENPSYGIFGLFHILPPAIAWLWRLVSPRGHANPSIVDTEGMTSEGVGSYWPFATGKRVNQANLLFDQFCTSLKVRYILCPVKHVGAWKVDFKPQWITREFIPRRGKLKFTKNQIKPARCSLLGYVLSEMTVEGQEIDPSFLDVSLQREVGKEAYDKGAQILLDFFRKQLKVYLDEPGLNPQARKIIELVYEDGVSVSDFENLFESEPIIYDDY